jgi:glycosyltransferase involved in cell wall biosynthesis
MATSSDLSAAQVPEHPRSGALRVCLDAAIVATGAPGISGYTQGLVAALRSVPDIDLTVVGPSSMAVADVTLPPEVGGVRSRFVWRERNLRRVLEEEGSDVLLVANPELPLRRTPIPSVVVVHDVFPLTAPALTGRGQQLRFRFLLPRVCARATRIVCVSEASRLALHNTVGVAPSKTTVIAQGPSSFPTLPRSPDQEEPYLLYVGELFERKNLATVLAALANGDPRLRLLLAGPADPDSLRRLRDRCAELGLRERVTHHGFVSEKSLAELHAGAAALVLPSLEEGFGRPVLDAMARGVPVIASDIAALRDLTDSAAQLVRDPLDPGEWREAIAAVLGDRAMRDALVKRGRERAAAFSWQDIAQRYRDLLLDVSR